MRSILAALPQTSSFSGRFLLWKLGSRQKAEKVRLSEMQQKEADNRAKAHKSE